MKSISSFFLICAFSLETVWFINNSMNIDENYSFNIRVKDEVSNTIPITQLFFSDETHLDDRCHLLQIHHHSSNSTLSIDTLCEPFQDKIGDFQLS